jgi:hypothetical protein
MILEAQGEGNPKHIRHVQLYCDYVDNAVAQAKKEILAELPRLVMECIKQPKVQVEVDENSLKRVQQKISSMLDGFFRRR